jgi:hypothetical protein
MLFNQEILDQAFANIAAKSSVTIDIVKYCYELDVNNMMQHVKTEYTNLYNA